MSTRVSRSNRIAQPSTPPVNMPSVKKLALRKGVPTYLTINGVLSILLQGRDGQALKGRDGQYLYGRA